MQIPTYWVACPKCGYPHFIKRRSDTKISNFPAFCKGCREEINITIRAKEPTSKSM